MFLRKTIQVKDQRGDIFHIENVLMTTEVERLLECLESLDILEVDEVNVADTVQF